jgi:hypothetical protein
MKSEEKKNDLTLSEAERVVINRYAQAKQLVDEFLAENHAGKADAQFTAVVRAFMDVITGMTAVHRLDCLEPKQGRGNMYVN